MAQFQSKERPDYQGTENLEVMSVAVNYNRFLHDQIHRYAPRHAQAMIYDFGAGTGQFTNIWNAKDVKVGAMKLTLPYAKDWLNKVMMYMRLTIYNTAQLIIFILSMCSSILRMTKL